jgi:hypothetical protein
MSFRLDGWTMYIWICICPCNVENLLVACGWKNIQCLLTMATYHWLKSILKMGFQISMCKSFLQPNKFWLLWHWEIHFVSLMWSLKGTYHGVKFSLVKPKLLFTFQVKDLIMHQTIKHNICNCFCDILWITKSMCNFGSQLGLIWSLFF